MRLPLQRFITVIHTSLTLSSINRETIYLTHLPNHWYFTLLFLINIKKIGIRFKISLTFLMLMRKNSVKYFNYYWTICIMPHISQLYWSLNHKFKYQ